MARIVKVILVAALAASWSLLPARGQTTYYVATNGVDGRDGTNWDTAVLTISNALAKTAASGDTILVSNGTYGLTVTNLIITKGVELRSLAGATNTMITRTGAGNFRILYISNVNAVVDGFTITNGYPSAGNNTKGGGIFIDWFGTVSNCIITGNKTSINGYGGGVYLNYGGYVKNCRIINNQLSSYGGAGVYCYRSGIVENCELSGNSSGGSGSGGGAYLDGGGLLRNCLIYNNAHYNRRTQDFPAGGVYCSTGRVENCTIVSNYGVYAGGVWCAAKGSVLNSIICFNTSSAGGVPNYSNTGTGWSYTNCCTTPAVPGVSNITADPQLTDIVSGNLRLLPGSPCIDTGANQDWMTTALDLDGNPRILNTNVDMGAYEYKIDALACSPNGNPVTGLASNNVVFTAGVAGTNTAGLYYRWDFENDSAFDIEGPDRQIVTNLYMPGLYSVRLVVTNAIGEIATCVKTNHIKVGPAIAYVATNGSAIYPYTNWAEAATNIQPAIDAGVDGTTVLVSNGVYLITSQVDLQKGITVQSINGASNTVVKRTGSSNLRIFYLSHSNAVVDGFTITNGRMTATGSQGGGVLIDFFGTVSNCLITGNSLEGGSTGGGVHLFYGGYVKNSRIINNQMTGFDGAGAYINSSGVIENCEIAGNADTTSVGGSGTDNACAGVRVAGRGLLRNCLIYNNTHMNKDRVGGITCDAGATVESCTIVSNYCALVGGLLCNKGGTVVNSIIYGNLSTNPGTENYSNSGSGWSYTNCCTTPAVAGDGNITADPLFVNTNAANYRLRSASPCVNAGTNQPWMLPVDGGAADLAGNRRIYFNRVDLGAYEVVPPKGTVLATW